jgi:hypothetical protein
LIPSISDHLGHHELDIPPAPVVRWGRDKAKYQLSSVGVLEGAGGAYRMAAGPEILEAYRDYTPPVPAKRIVERLLKSLPETYLIGLKTVVLRNSEGLHHRERKKKLRHRKQKFALRDCPGYYVQKWHGNHASIEILVDQVVANTPAIILWFSVFQDMLFAFVLYHEVGHHIHISQRPEHKEKEDVAEKWSNRLTLRYLKRRYWYLFYSLYVLLKPVYLVKKAMKKKARR